jgi:GNAT superfamily N-acetyltransferase
MIQIERVDGLLHHADLQDMQAECFPQDRPWATEEGDWWIAFEDREFPVGFACLTAGAKTEDVGYLALAGVMPEARGLGLQRKLIKVREKRARELGRKRLLTYTCHNPQSTMNLIRCGFHIYKSPTDWADQRRFPEVTTLRKFML